MKPNPSPRTPSFAAFAWHGPRVIRVGLLLGLLVSWSSLVWAQLNENCTVSILNRTVRVKADGTWTLPNVPAGFGLVRARVNCVENGVVRSGQSDFFTILPNRMNAIEQIVLGAVDLIPSSLTLTSPGSVLTAPGATAQLTTIAAYPDGSTRNVTAVLTGTSYTSSSPSTATVSPAGLVTARASGTVIVSALNDGAVGMLQLRVVLTGDADNDGLPDDLEVANGLNPNNPVDAEEDPDRDGLTNKQELLDFGTNRRLADTDSDGILDGEEVVAGRDGFITSPLLADTDGDGVRDKLELDTGSDPTNPASLNLAEALQSLEVTPVTFVLTVNTIIGEASRQLTATGHLRDGTTIDLTSTARGTTYNSSDLFVANFGSPDGRVFAGNTGTAIITVANSGFSQPVEVTVRTSSPQTLGFVEIDGFANNVDVAGDVAFVAAGSAGLQVVDVSDRTTPRVVAGLDTPGNANDVKILGPLGYIADGPGGLQIADLSDTLSPSLMGVADTPGTAWDVAVSGNRAYVADGTAGLQVLDISNPTAPTILGTVDTLGTAKGVDVQGNIAVVADGNTGLQIVNIADPSQPNIIGSVALGGDSRDVVISGNYAFVADFSRSFTSVEITDPTAPIIRASTPSSTGGVLQDVAVAGRFAFGADAQFGNRVTIIDVADPATPIPRAVMSFPNFLNDRPNGLAVDSSYVYMTASSANTVENGTTGNTRLFIGQYLAIEDTRGIPPVVSIQSPLNGTTFIETETIAVSVEATDDVEVTSVRLLFNGQVVGSDASPPFEFNVTAPTDANLATLVAQAFDFAGNQGESLPIVLTVIPDPGTSVRGRIVDAEGGAVQGAEVTVFDNTATSGPDGSFLVEGVPTLRGSIIVNATVEIDGTLFSGASSPAIPPVRGGITEVGNIILTEAAFETRYGASLAQCDDCWVEVDLPFEFPFFGQSYPRVFFTGNGLVTFEFGTSDFTQSISDLSSQPLVSVLWNDWDASEIPDSGLFYNGGLPGRAIFTWLNIPPFPANVESPRVTIQIILFADGRVQFGYNGVNVPFGVVGISAGPGAPRSVIDFTALSNFTFAGPAVIAEEFDSNPFDMDSHFVTWTPNAEAGFDVRVVAGAASPDSPAESRISLAGVRPPLGSTTKPLTISFISRPGQRYRLESMVARGAESTGWERATEPFVGTGAELTIELPPHAYTGELLYRVIRLE